MRKRIKAFNGSVQMIVCEHVSDDGMDFQMEHSILVERLQGITGDEE